MWFRIQLCSWPAVWPWEITRLFRFPKKKSSKNKQTNKPYLHKTTAGDLEIELLGGLKFSLRTYFCNLFLTNCSWDTEQKWEPLDQYLLSLNVCSPGIWNEKHLSICSLTIWRWSMKTPKNKYMNFYIEYIDTFRIVKTIFRNPLFYFSNYTELTERSHEAQTCK